MERNYNALVALCKLDDNVIINVEEAALLTGFAANTIRQRKVKGFPPPLATSRHLKWPLGDIRKWIAAQRSQG